LTFLVSEDSPFNMNITIEAAEALPFTRAQMSDLLGVSVRQMNNWLDRNQVWPEGRASVRRGYYRLADVFDLGGFAALRVAGVPERRAAQYTRCFGFYRSFLGGGDQLASFSYRNSQWDIGVYDQSAVVSVVINMRSLGAEIFRRLARSVSPTPGEAQSEAFLQFQNYYFRLVELDRLSAGTVADFESSLAR
jgi:hypothetical protein